MKNSETIGMNRVQWVDTAKGIGILLVVIGHVTFCPWPLKQVIYSCHMPLFFFLSGLFAKNNLSWNYVWVRFKRLVFPYYIFTALSCFLYFALAKAGLDIYADALKTDLRVESLLGAGLLWFLPCLFCVNILMGIVLKIRSEVLRIVSLLFISTIGLLSENSIWPFHLNAAFVGTIFCFAGWRMKNYLLGKIKPIIGFLTTVIFIICSWHLISTPSIGTTDFYSCEYMGAGHSVIQLFVFFLSSFSGLFSVLFLSQQVDSLKIFRNLGCDSLYIYAMHFPVVLMGCVLCFHIFGGQVPFPYMETLLIAIGVLIIIELGFVIFRCVKGGGSS